MKKTKKNLSLVTYHLSLRQGFSLVEVLITLMIFSIGISSISILMIANIKGSLASKDQVIASELAQEGIELVRNLKENQDIILPKFSADVSEGSNYNVDYGSSYADFKASATNANKKMYLVGGLFSHTATGTATKFYRKIAISTVSGNKNVTSIVSWNGSSIPTTCNVANKCVSVTTVLVDL